MGRQRPLRSLPAQGPLSGAKRTLRSPNLRTIYDHNGAPGRSRCRGKLTFPKLIIDPVCHATAILKGPFLKFYWKTKGAKLVFNARKSSVGVGAFPTGERVQEICIAMPDGYNRGESSFHGYRLVRGRSGDWMCSASRKP